MVAGMLMPMRDLRAIYEILFRDGVMVAKKDKRPQIKHPDVQDVSNLQVIRAMGSLKSRGFVKETFAWRHFYWYLTNEGIVYLRDYLHLPAEIVPASLQRIRKPAATLAIAHRAARVQSVHGPTSYVPKPGQRGESESQEAMVERRSYRHKMSEPGERENYSDRTPRFRGRHLNAEQARPKASWELEEKHQPLNRRGTSSNAPQVRADDVQPLKGKRIVTEVIMQQEDNGVNAVSLLEKDEPVLPAESPKVSVEDPVKKQEEQHSSESAEIAADAQVIKDAKQAVEGSSKSKRKKRKSPVDMSKSTVAEDKTQSEVDKVKSPAEVEEKNIHSTLTMASETLTEVSYKKTTDRNKDVADLDGNREQIREVPQKPNAKSKSKAEETSLPEVSQVDGQVKGKTSRSNISEARQGAIPPKDMSHTALSHMEPVKSEETTGHKVETVTVQKTVMVQKTATLTRSSPKPEEKTPEPPSESKAATVEAVSQMTAEKAAEEPSKGKKKGKGKRQAKQTPVSETINSKPVLLPDAETVPSAGKTTLAEAADTLEGGPVQVFQLTETEVFPEMTPERMCSEEVRQAAAVLSEAPVDKGEVEPELLATEKIKREVPKPETSSTVREAPAAETQASPLFEREEPPRVAQHLASQAAECSTEERLSVTEALEQREEKKTDSGEDTPSTTATPVSQPDQAHLKDTCESKGSDIDEAAMKRKIVVVEEIVEVKHLISPESDGEQQPPPAVLPEAEEEELDLDVLEAIAIERALLSGTEGVEVQGASPEAEWDHSLEEPEEKTWPNFLEELLPPQPPLSPPPPVPLAPTPYPRLGVLSLLPLAMAEQADGSKQQAQPVKTEDKGETRQLGANKLEPSLVLIFFASSSCLLLDRRPPLHLPHHLLDEDHTRGAQLSQQPALASSSPLTLLHPLFQQMAAGPPGPVLSTLRVTQNVRGLRNAVNE
ncbi:unnamed protein product [Menidia menidia]|uniref:(Atlantic silverside) hypothetical protein n=1 Tax=Menidia menidia TaxID=238744 RepID=A0A8S4BZ01_9TELE|nr:unnamed protein product [Menidia menidia]